MSTVESLRLRQIFAREAITAYLHKPLQIAEVEYAIQKVMPKKISPWIPGRFPSPTEGGVG
jgi:hypothetical protein